MSALQKLFSTLQIPGLLALILACGWVSLITLLFVAWPLAFVLLGFMIWAFIEVFAAAASAMDTERDRRLAGNLRRLVVAAVLAAFLTITILHPGTDRMYRAWLPCLFGGVPSLGAFLLDCISAPKL